MQKGIVNTYSFYQQPKWLKCAAYIRKKYQYTCQVCGKRGNLIHHIKPLTQEDYINRPLEKCYGEDNLTCLCFQCHEDIHSKGNIRKELYFDENGEIQIKEKPDISK